MSKTTLVVAVAGALLMVPAAEAGPGFRAGTILPERSAVLAHVDHGQGGREVMDAVFRHDHADVERLIRHDPPLARTSDGKHFDLLSVAVGLQDVDMVRLLLRLGAPPNGPHGEGALILALRANGPELAEALLAGGADPNATGPRAVQPLDEAVMLTSKGAVRLLLDKGANPNQADAVGSTPFTSACTIGAAEIAELLLDHGADPWAVGVNGDTAADYLRTAPERGGADAAARERLIRRLQALGAWPPIPPAEVRRLVLAGRWPPAGAKGRPPSPGVVAIMRANWSADGKTRRP